MWLVLAVRGKDRFKLASLYHAFGRGIARRRYRTNLLATPERFRITSKVHGAPARGKRGCVCEYGTSCSSVGGP